MERRDKKGIGHTRTNNEPLGMSAPRAGEKVLGRMIKSTGRGARRAGGNVWN